MTIDKRDKIDLALRAALIARSILGLTDIAGSAELAAIIFKQTMNMMIELHTKIKSLNKGDADED